MSVTDPFYPARGQPKLKLGEARKAIREYRKVRGREPLFLGLSTDPIYCGTADSRIRTLNDLAKAQRVSKFESPEFGTILRQRRCVLQPGVAVVRRLPGDDSTHGIEPQRGSVLCALTFKVK